jgi:hypothetical protein
MNKIQIYLVSLLCILLPSCGSEISSTVEKNKSLPSDSSVWMVTNSSLEEIFLPQYFFFPNDSIILSLTTIPNDALKPASTPREIQSEFPVGSYFFIHLNDLNNLTGKTDYQVSVRLIIKDQTDSTLTLRIITDKNELVSEYELMRIEDKKSIPINLYGECQHKIESYFLDTLLTFKKENEKMEISYFHKGVNYDTREIVPCLENPYVFSQRQSDTFFIDTKSNEIYVLFKDDFNATASTSSINNYVLQRRNIRDSIDLAKALEVYLEKLKSEEANKN